MELRNYQQTFYDRIHPSIATGHRRIMCVAPCGTIDIDIVI